jgi:hypothetical protein
MIIRFTGAAAADFGGPSTAKTQGKTAKNAKKLIPSLLCDLCIFLCVFAVKEASPASTFQQ